MLTRMPIVEPFISIIPLFLCLIASFGSHMTSGLHSSFYCALMNFHVPTAYNLGHI